jgi:hypothetical protein
MTVSLPQKADQYFIDEILVPNWDKTNTKGYDANTAALPTSTSISNVGAKSPSIIVQSNNETSPNQTGYNFMTNSGPGQTRTGTLIATIRAEDGPDGPLQDVYENDGTGAITAEEIVTLLRQEIERVTLANPTAGTTEFTYVSTFPAGGTPDDLDSDPAVRQESVTINYGWIRSQ